MPFLFYGQIIFHRVGAAHFVHHSSPSGGCLGFLYLLAIMIDTAINIYMQIFA
jgi:hypothetical protein